MQNGLRESSLADFLIGVAGGVSVRLCLAPLNGPWIYLSACSFVFGLARRCGYWAERSGVTERSVSVASVASGAAVRLRGGRDWRRSTARRPSRSRGF